MKFLKPRCLVTFVTDGTYIYRPHLLSFEGYLLLFSVNCVLSRPTTVCASCERKLSVLVSSSPPGANLVATSFLQGPMINHLSSLFPTKYESHGENYANIVESLLVDAKVVFNPTDGKVFGSG